MLNILIFILVLSIVTVGTWRWYLSAPLYYNSDGGSLWEKTMSIVEKKSIWPYKTVYKTNWNCIKMSINNQTKVSRWFEFILWNGHGVESIEVVGVNTSESVYPTKEKVGTLQTDMTYIEPLHNTQNEKYFIVKVKPPEDETELKITVVDKLGNITSDTVTLDPVPD